MASAHPSLSLPRALVGAAGRPSVTAARRRAAGSAPTPLRAAGVHHLRLQALRLRSRDDVLALVKRRHGRGQRRRCVKRGEAGLVACGRGGNRSEQAAAQGLTGNVWWQRQAGCSSISTTGEQT
jgi:hypothetical protein